MNTSENTLGASENLGNNQDGIGATRNSGAEISAKVDSIKVKPFTGKSYHLWKFKMSQYLDMMEVWEYVNGKTPQPLQQHPNLREERGNGAICLQGTCCVTG
jgi:hypothetical protein